ncbi:MAG: hypothetical protein HY952_08805 [Elusimicrobia bacterium]|nr:hypothetical protein [Elusimicrobiota bacterium]
MKRLFPYFPIISLFAYWLYGCVAGALVSGDPRLLKISFVSLPVVLGMALGAVKLYKTARAQE